MGSFLPWLYLLRVPLIFGALLAGLAPFSLLTDSPGRELFGGLFDLDSWGVCWATVAAFFVAAACSFSSWLVFKYGDLRFGVPERNGWTGRKVLSLVGDFQVDRLGFLLGLLYSGGAVAVIAGIVLKTGTSQGAAPMGGVVTGVVLFVFLVILAGLLWHRYGANEARFVAELLAFTAGRHRWL